MLALVTCLAARDLDSDLPLLCRELPDAVVVAWDDSTVDWPRFDTVIVRSAWNYHDRRDEFVGWCRAVAAHSALWNPLSLIEWNTDKRYLDDVAGWGVPTVPTTFAAPGDGVDGELLTGDVVIKPSVGAGSNLVVRTRHDEPAARSHVAMLHAAGRTAMVQPYVAAIDARGETGLVYVGGEFSHAFGKEAILSRPIRSIGELYVEEQIAPRVATNAERAVGDAVIAALPATAYARIDLLPGDDGPLVVEVEVTEPSLFLDCDPGAPARAAAAFRSLGA